MDGEPGLVVGVIVVKVLQGIRAEEAARRDSRTSDGHLLALLVVMALGRI